MALLRSILVRCCGCTIGALLAGCNSLHQPEPARIERYGDIEVVIQTRKARSANYDREADYEAWSLHRHGEPLMIDSFGGLWLDQPMRTAAVNSLFVAGGGTPPDLLVNVGDPNNGSVFHLLHQEGGTLTVHVLCKAFSGENAVRVLEGALAGQVFRGPNYRSLAGAGRILLGNACVYDAATRRADPIPAKPDDAYFPYDAQGIALSPDGRALARFALLSETEQPLMLVADLDAGTWSRLPIDAGRMRFPDYEAIDISWINHHFQWQRGSDGRERLTERKDFKPLPRRGVFRKGSAEYNVPHLTAGQSERLGEFLVRRFGGRLLPHDPKVALSTLPRYEIEQEVVVVSETGFFIMSSMQPYWPGQPGDPKRQEQLIGRIGEAFDQELAEGRHEIMFGGDESR